MQQKPSGNTCFWTHSNSSPWGAGGVGGGGGGAGGGGGGGGVGGGGGGGARLKHQIVPVETTIDFA